METLSSTSLSPSQVNSDRNVLAEVEANIDELVIDDPPPAKSGSTPLEEDVSGGFAGVHRTCLA